MTWHPRPYSGSDFNSPTGRPRTDAATMPSHHRAHRRHGDARRRNSIGVRFSMQCGRGLTPSPFMDRSTKRCFSALQTSSPIALRRAQALCQCPSSALLPIIQRTQSCNHALSPRGEKFHRSCEGLRTPATTTIPARQQPASAKRQWTKSREVGDYGAAGATRV